MASANDLPTGPSTSLPARCGPYRTIGWVGVLVAEGVAILWFINELSGGNIAEASRIGQFLLTATMAGLGILLFQRRRKLVDGPLRKLNALLPEVCKGDAPIDELSAVGGRLTPVVLEIQELLRTIRRQQSEVNQEIRQRINNRTSALERTIGSLRQQAGRDTLTGLYNRRAFDQCLTTAIDRARASGADLSLLLIDLDNFKVLNDALGHPAGDEWLRSMGQIIRSTIRDGDVAFRWGGDEFAVLLENTDPPAARALGDRLSSLARAMGKTYKLPKPPGMSVGISSFHEVSEKTSAAMFSAADQSLYQIKKDRKRAA